MRSKLKSEIQKKIYRVKNFANFSTFLKKGKNLTFLIKKKLKKSFFMKKMGDFLIIWKSNFMKKGAFEFKLKK